MDAWLMLELQLPRITPIARDEMVATLPCKLREERRLRRACRIPKKSTLFHAAAAFPFIAGRPRATTSAPPTPSPVRRMAGHTAVIGVASMREYGYAESTALPGMCTNEKLENLPTATSVMPPICWPAPQR